MSQATKDSINPLIVDTAPSDTIYKCADVLEFIAETAHLEMTHEARQGVEAVTAAVAAALRYEAKRVQYARKVVGHA